METRSYRPFDDPQLNDPTSVVLTQQQLREADPHIRAADEQLGAGFQVGEMWACTITGTCVRLTGSLDSSLGAELCTEVAYKCGMSALSPRALVVVRSLPTLCLCTHMSRPCLASSRTTCAATGSKCGMRRLCTLWGAYAGGQVA